MPGKWSERPPTELERKIDAEPVIESWEAQAFISSSAGADFIVAEPHFVVQWRNLKTGEERTKVFYPWPEMSPFDMASSEKLFGYRDRPMQYKDPWVITVRTKDGVPLEVARDMTGQAKLQAVFFTLSRHFGVERRAAFFLERAAERKRRGLDQPIVEEAPVTTDGIRLRPPI